MILFSFFHRPSSPYFVQKKHIRSIRDTVYSAEGDRPVKGTTGWPKSKNNKSEVDDQSGCVDTAAGQNTPQIVRSFFSKKKKKINKDIVLF